MAYINKETSKIIENYLANIAKTGSIQISNGFISKNLFKSIEETKKVCGFLTAKGLDPFKRGTKEPEKIREVLNTADWNEVNKSNEVGVSMWD